MSEKRITTTNSLGPSFPTTKKTSCCQFLPLTLLSGCRDNRGNQDREETETDPGPPTPGLTTPTAAATRGHQGAGKPRVSPGLTTKLFAQRRSCSLAFPLPALCLDFVTSTPGLHPRPSTSHLNGSCIPPQCSFYPCGSHRPHMSRWRQS